MFSRFFLLFSLVTLSVPALADAQWFRFSVERIMVTDDDQFGGCMIKPSVDISERIDCMPQWVTLDCAGKVSSKATGRRKYDLVLLTQVQGQELSALITNDKKVNGWCLAERVQP